MTDMESQTGNGGKSPLSEGVKGVAMAAPFVAVPALLHAAGGLFVSGITLGPLLLVTGGLASQFLPPGMTIKDLLRSAGTGKVAGTSDKAGEAQGS